MPYYLLPAKLVKIGDIIATPGIRPAIVESVQCSMYGASFVCLRANQIVHDYARNTELRMYEGDYADILEQ